MSSAGGWLQALMAVSFAVPAFIMANRLWQVWREPMALEAGAWVNRGIGIFIMEFILTNAGLLLVQNSNALDSQSQPWGTLILLTLFYGLFALAIAAVFKSGNCQGTCRLDE